MAAYSARMIVAALALIVPFEAPLPPSPVTVYRLTNETGMAVELVGRGATIVRITLPDGKRRRVDVLVSPPPKVLAAGGRRYASIVGRYAGRLRGSVTIDGFRYNLATNASGVTLHGGAPGLDRADWKGRRIDTDAATGIEFTHVSANGAQGFPGTVSITARYLLRRKSNVLSLEITAVSDRRTVLNLTNHAYFDLSGRHDLGDQELTVDANRSVALDARKLPTGELSAVAGTSLDFRRGQSLGSIVSSGGMDGMLALGPTHKAVLRDRKSGRTLTLTTNQPGLQVYTGNGFDGSDRDPQGRPIARFAGVALEAENFPDAPNIDGFPSAYVAPGTSYRWRTQWKFTTGDRG